MPAELSAAAEQRLQRIREQIAMRIDAKMTRLGIGLREASQEIGVDLNCLFRMVHIHDERYSNPTMCKLHFALEWLELTWGAVDREPTCRQLGMGDIRLAILDLDLSQRSRQVMIEMNDALYRALREMEVGGGNS